jgi:hypothetical protein
VSAEKRPISELVDHGLLWLINTTVFHPRGFALGLQTGDDDAVDAWELLGDGSEPWVFAPDAETQARVHECFTKVEALFNSQRGEA